MSSSKSTASLVTLAVIIMGLGGYLFLGGGSEGLGESSVSPSDTLATETETGDTQLPEAEGRSGETGLVSAADETQRVDVTLEEEAEEGRQAEADKQWVTGRVAFGTPLPTDEELHVLSLDDEYSARRLYGSDGGIASAVWDSTVDEDHLYDWAVVEKDGSFRISLPGDRSVAHLALSGHYVYSLGSTSISLPAGEDDLVLTGVVGGRITGRVMTPNNDEPISSADVDLELMVDIGGGFDAFELREGYYGHEVKTDSEGNFEFRGVAPNRGRGIVTHHELLATSLNFGLKLEAGEHLELDVRMQRGATIRGRLLDGDGEGIADEEVSVSLPGQVSEAVGTLRSSTTDSDGAFELKNVLVGQIVQLSSSPSGLLPGAMRLEDKLRDGQVLEGLQFEIEQGQFIKGTVTYPDGTLAAGVEVNTKLDITKVNMQMMGMAPEMFTVVSVETDEEGRFFALGLGDGPFVVLAQGSNEEGPHQGEWSARQANVAAGQEGVTLKLEGLTPLMGLVVNEQEAEIGKFEVSLTLKDSGGMMGMGATRMDEKFDAPEEDGGFRVPAVGTGTWEVRVGAEGFAPSATIVVEIPQAEGAELPVFDLVLSASASGIVVDSFGNPVSGAKVSLARNLAKIMEGSSGGTPPSTTTDLEGEFILEGLEPGSASILGKAEGFAGSAALGLELISGETVPDLRLTLRTGGILSGDVYDDDGEPAEGRMVIAQLLPSYSVQHIMTSGSLGEFRVENLEPGTWQVVSMANPMTGEAEAEEIEETKDMLAGLKMASVEIKDGEETVVHLGAPPEDPIEVFGVVMHGGEMVGGALISFLPDGAEGISSIKMSACDDEGRFHLTLDKRGHYLVSIQNQVSTGQQNTVEQQVEVPEDAESQNLTLELPGGGISGRVTGLDGKPAGNCRVSLRRDGGANFGTLLGGHYSELATEEDGTYEILYLAPGKYVVSAGGATLGGMLGDDSAVGRVVLGNIEVGDGEVVTGVNFRLKKPYELGGSVIDGDQKPIAGAAVFVRDGEGRLLDKISFVTTDAGGKFQYGGLAEGSYTVSAKKGGLVSVASVPANVGEGANPKVQLVIDEGTVLIVSVTDKSGGEVNARLSVLNADGHEMVGAKSLADMMDYGTGFSSLEQRVGPLPQGKYRVRAELDDGRETHKNLSLSGRAERKVKLRIK
ncbi:MAG: hypothetical protein ACI8X5_003026 [Planctomycetota bacterium]|jgi:hypothetical protein